MSMAKKSAPKTRTTINLTKQ